MQQILNQTHSEWYQYCSSRKWWYRKISSYCTLSNGMGSLSLGLVFYTKSFKIPDRENRFIGEYGSNINEVFNENYYMKYNERQYTLNYADCNVKDTTGKLNSFEYWSFCFISYSDRLYIWLEPRVQTNRGLRSIET